MFMVTTALGCSVLADEAQTHSVGNRVEDPGFSTDQWESIESDSQLVWAAETCLGFFETRDTLLLSPDPMVFDPTHGANVYSENELARIHIFNWPFNEFGVFQCTNTKWPAVSLTNHDIEELAHWISYRLTDQAGWEGTFDLQTKAFDFVKFRNRDHGASIRVYSIGGRTTFSIEAAYFGPPIIFDQEQW